MMKGHKVANAIIAYTKGSFFKEGCNLTSVISIDMKGKLGNFSKRNIAERLAYMPNHNAIYVMHGVNPKYHYYDV